MQDGFNVPWRGSAHHVKKPGRRAINLLLAYREKTYREFILKEDCA